MFAGRALSPEWRFSQLQPSMMMNATAEVTEGGGRRYLTWAGGALRDMEVKWKGGEVGHRVINHHHKMIMMKPVR